MKRLALVLLAVGVLALAGCAAGPGSEWAAPDAAPAGFWVGLWHGILMFVTLIVSFFTDQVRIYEVHNSGLAYDIGFVLGALGAYGSGFRVTVRRKKRLRGREAEEDLGKRVEAEIKRRVSRMLEDDDDWKELGEKIERKVKDRLRRWLDEQDGKAPGS